MEQESGNSKQTTRFEGIARWTGFAIGGKPTPSRCERSTACRLRLADAARTIDLQVLQYVAYRIVLV